MLKEKEKKNEEGEGKEKKKNRFFFVDSAVHVHLTGRHDNKTFHVVVTSAKTE